MNTTKLPKVTLFYGGKHGVKPHSYITWFDVIDLFTKNESVKSSINSIRKLKSEGKAEEASKLKNELPFIITAGEFTYRNNDSLIESTYSWVCPVDIDEKENPNIDWEKLFSQIIQNPSVFLCVKSPRGVGLKALVWLSHKKYNPQQQYIVFRDSVYPYLEKIWGCKIDIAQGKLSQPFYVTHDENAYINKKAEPLDIDYNNYQVETIINGEVHFKDSGMKPFANSIENRKDGKWTYFGQIAFLVGGLLSGKVIKEKSEPLKVLLEAAARNRHVKKLSIAETQIKNSFESGKKEPLTKEDINVKNATFSLLRHLNKPLLHNYVRVGGKYYKKYQMSDRYGHKKSILDVWPKDEIKMDNGYDGLLRVPQYDAFIVEPDNINYKHAIDNCYNLYNEFAHKPIKGKCQWSLAMVKHIFAEHYEMGLDYMKVLYLYPKQILPVLAIVSIVQDTGKTTFLNWLSQIFGDNMAIVRSEDLISDFTSLYASKNVICVDETILDKSHASSRLKNISTAKELTYNEKWGKQKKIPFFGKIILATNKETDFMKMDNEDVRYWVRKIIKPDTDNINMDDDLRTEIPAFLYYLKERKFSVERESRMWFAHKRIQTDALKKVVENSKKWLYKEMLELFQNYFEENGDDTIFANPVDIKFHFFKNNHKTEVSYIRKVLKEDFKYTPSNQVWYYPFNIKTEEKWVNGKSETVNLSKKSGTPYIFLRGEIEELYKKYVDV